MNKFPLDLFQALGDQSKLLIQASFIIRGEKHNLPDSVSLQFITDVGDGRDLSSASWRGK